MFSKRQKKALKEVGIKVRKITNRHDSGADGIIYLYDKDKVIKIADNIRLNQDAFLSRMWYISRPRKCTVRIYDYGLLPPGLFTYECYNHYYLVMERLNRISPDIRIFFSKLRDYLLEYLNGDHRRCEGLIREHLYPENEKRVRHFLASVRKLKWWHNDMHGYNIMQDDAGNLKLIDLESLAPRYKDAEAEATNTDKGK